MAKDWSQDEVIKELEQVLDKQDKEIERLREVLRLTNRIIMNFSEKSVQIHNDLLTTIPKIEAALKEGE